MELRAELCDKCADIGAFVLCTRAVTVGEETRQAVWSGWTERAWYSKSTRHIGWQWAARSVVDVDIECEAVRLGDNDTVDLPDSRELPARGKLVLAKHVDVLV